MQYRAEIDDWTCEYWATPYAKTSETHSSLAKSLETLIVDPLTLPATRNPSTTPKSLTIIAGNQKGSLEINLTVSSSFALSTIATTTQRIAIIGTTETTQ